MSDSSTPEISKRAIPFTVDGKRYTTEDVSQRASSILELAGLDPAKFDLGEIEGKEHPQTRRFQDQDLVEIRKDAQFVSIRQKAPVA